MRLLLVEDDETTIESIKLCIEICETDSVIVSTRKGKEAVELVKKQIFDAVLVDLGLPDIDGTEVIQEMRRFTAVPVVVLSARHSPEVVSRALALGADDYVTKPFDY
ncbi:MAG TPA: response regulator, partial [Dehalococcoidales bacterium]|nr:response regulator [Dehalococcoidales bacterium]